MKKNQVYIQISYETDDDVLVDKFVEDINAFISCYDGRSDESMASRVTIFKGTVLDDPWRTFK